MLFSNVNIKLSKFKSGVHEDIRIKKKFIEHRYEFIRDASISV